MLNLPSARHLGAQRCHRYATSSIFFKGTCLDNLVIFGDQCQEWEHAEAEKVIGSNSATGDPGDPGDPTVTLVTPAR